VILVDDVVTTGATLAAAARPLLEAGATTVIGLVIARA
jgi:predicted amidophosphoribosyltransferase